MNVTVVCTGNVARSPAMARVLMEMCPQHTFYSAAVGARALPGRVMACPMREILVQHGFGEYAKAHRSKLFADRTEDPDLVIACAPVHMKHLERIAPDVKRLLSNPIIFDPAFRSNEYKACWDLIIRAANVLASTVLA
jgi:protein-tyrosine-phosphatase